MSHNNKDIRELHKELKKGYIEMSGINLEEAELGLRTDNEALEVCEKNFSECE